MTTVVHHTDRHCPLTLVSQLLGRHQQLRNVLLSEYRFGLHESLRVVQQQARETKPTGRGLFAVDIEVKVLLANPVVSAVGANGRQRLIEAARQRIVLAYRNADARAEVLFLGEIGTDKLEILALWTP